jgi:broad specificity phosphatase PhoE
MNQESNNFCTIYLVRHGEAEGNARGIIMGHRDMPLTAKGEAQARETAEKLKDIHFDHVYSSDLIRARRTAEIILQEKKLAITTSKLLRERTYGIHEGKNYADYSEDTKTFWDSLEKLSEEGRNKVIHPDGIESDAEIARRMITFLKEIAVASPGKTVLVATHGGILRAFLIHIGYAKREGFPDIKNGAFIKVLGDGVDFIVKETSWREEDNDVVKPEKQLNY